MYTSKNILNNLFWWTRTDDRFGHKPYQPGMKLTTGNPERRIITSGKQRFLVEVSEILEGLCMRVCTVA